MRTELLKVTDQDIASATRSTLELWYRAMGEDPRGVLVTDLRQRVGRLFVRIRQPGPFVLAQPKRNPLPWRITPEAFKEVDRRVCSMVYPHKTEPVVKDGECTLTPTLTPTLT